MAVAGIAVVIEAVTGAAAAVGDAVVDAIEVDARRVVLAGVICLLPNMRRHRAASPADMTIVADNLAVTTIGARKFRATQRLP